MMLACILSPIGRWLSLVGAVFAALGIVYRKGRGAVMGAKRQDRQRKGTIWVVPGKVGYPTGLQHGER